MSEISFHIQGMTCANCSMAIEKAFKKADGIQKATINLSQYSDGCPPGGLAGKKNGQDH